MINPQYIKLNMTPSGVLPVLHCSQYDIGRPLGFVVYNGAEAVDLDNYTVTIEATRSDDVAITAAATTDGNIGVFATTATMTNKADRYPAQCVLVDGSSNRVASLPFMMFVIPAVMDENEETIEEDASLYQQYTASLRGTIAQIRSALANDANELSALSGRIDNMIALQTAGSMQGSKVTTFTAQNASQYTSSFDWQSFSFCDYSLHLNTTPAMSVLDGLSNPVLLSAGAYILASQDASITDECVYVNLTDNVKFFNHGYLGAAPDKRAVEIAVPKVTDAAGDISGMWLLFTFSVVSDVPVDLSEVTDIRIGTDGHTFSTAGDAVRDQLEKKVNIPLDEYDVPQNGTNGQILKTNGDGSTDWIDAALPSDDQVEEAVSYWLAEHPEIITTVQDGSLTFDKFTAATNIKIDRCYDTVAQMKADTGLLDGGFCRTLGYYAVNDGGGAMYQISATAPGTYHETLSNGLFAELIFGETVTPKMFGARGNGATDDTTAFLNCFDAIHKNIYIPQGVYLITGKITVGDDTTVKSDGFIRKSGTFDILFDVGTNCDIQLNIDNDKASATDFTSQTSADIRLIGKSGTRIHDSKVLNTDSRYAIWIEKCADLIVENCIVDTYVYTGIGCRDGNNNVKIINNTVLNGHGTQSNRYAICLNSSAGGLEVSANMLCDGNYIEDSEPAWEAIDAHDIVNAVISNNIIINTASGISIVDTESASDNVLIKGNIYRRNIQLDFNRSSFGIVCTPVANSKNFIVCDNVIDISTDNIGTNDKGGIKIIGINGAKIFGNIINGSATGDGIVANSYTPRVVENIEIKNNAINGFNIGINLQNTSGSVFYGIVEKNIIQNCTVGLDGMENAQNTYNGGGVFAENNIYENCTTEYQHNTQGLTVSPTPLARSNWGVKNRIFVNENPDNGNILSVCTQSAEGNTGAVWGKAYNIIPIHGSYTTDHNTGAITITDTRIRSAGFAIGCTPYVDSASFGKTVHCKCYNGYITVYVRNADGTPFAGTITLFVLVANAF